MTRECFPRTPSLRKSFLREQVAGAPERSYRAKPQRPRGSHRGGARAPGRGVRGLKSDWGQQRPETFKLFLELETITLVLLSAWPCQKMCRRAEVVEIGTSAGFLLHDVIVIGAAWYCRLLSFNGDYTSTLLFFLNNFFVQHNPASEGCFCVTTG